MLRSDANIYDTFYLENSLSYLNEDDANTHNDKSINGKPISNEIIKNSKLKGVIGKIGGIGADSNEPTRNGRRYPLELWQNVEKSEYFIEGMENRSLIGEADHPQERLDYSITEGAIVLTKYEIQNDGKVYTEFDILDTIPGRTVKTYFDAGCKLGVSSRGLGEEIMRDGEKIIDPDTYQFYCFDVVAFPAVKSARMELIESTSPKKQKLINSITSEINKCKSLDEVRFIESMSQGVNLYLDEIKEAIDMKKQDLYKKENVSNLFNQLKENIDEDTKKNLSSEILKYISDAPTQTLIRNILFDPENKINWNNVEDYIKNNMPEFSIKEKIESNKIKISDGDNNSDEDTPDVDDKQSDSNLEILAELQEQITANDSKINLLNNQLEQKNLVIRNLLSKINKSESIMSNNLNEKTELTNSLTNLNSRISMLESELEKKSTDYIKLENLYNNLKKVNSEFSNIVETLQTKYNNLDKVKESITQELKTTKLSYQSLKESTDKSIKKDLKSMNHLNEDVISLKNINHKLIEENKSFKLNETKNQEIIEKLSIENKKYKKQYYESLDKYINQICKQFNLKESTLRRLLGKSYTISDIDSIAKELSENISKINSLPFKAMRPDKQIYVENIGLQESDSNSKYVNESLDSFDFLLNVKK